MKGEHCADKVRQALKGMGEVEIDSELGRVVVHTQEPWFVLKEKIEETGRKAVLNGFGGQSAVSIINTTGSDVDRSMSSTRCCEIYSYTKRQTWFGSRRCG